MHADGGERHGAIAAGSLLVKTASPVTRRPRVWLSVWRSAVRWASGRRRWKQFIPSPSVNVGSYNTPSHDENKIIHERNRPLEAVHDSAVVEAVLKILKTTIFIPSPPSGFQ